MLQVIIVVNGQEVVLKFGYGVLRRLSEKWGVDSVTGVFEKFGAVASAEGATEFGQLNLFGDVVEASASNGGFIVSADDAVDVLLSNPEKMQEIVKCFVASLPAEKKNQEVK